MWLAVGLALLQAGGQERLFGQRTVEGFSLLRLPRVQKELGMKRGQVLRIIARDQAAEDLLDGSAEPPKPAELVALTKRQEEIRDKAVAEVLNEAQQKRLLQILAQQQGGSLLLKKEMEQTLKLSETQRFALYSIHEETVKKVKAEQGQPPRTPSEAKARQAKLAKIRLAGYNHMLRALTPEQRKQYRELLGRPVKLD